MKHSFVLFSVAMLGACFIAPEDHELGTAVGSQRCVRQLGQGELVCVTVPPIVCSGVACAQGEVCCVTTGACVTPGVATCPVLPTTARNGATACSTNADCAVDEYCTIDDVQQGTGPYPSPRCIGSAHCQPMNLCASCGPAGSARCQVCGCDGVTYESPQAACVAGMTVAVFSQGACGSTVCGTDAQCGADQKCCFRTGKCFDPSEPWRCELKDSGVILDCASHEECNPPMGGGSGSEPPSFLCAGASCSGPGLCSRRGSTSDCGGVVQSVCGCDGQTYVNACWAKVGGARVASSGVCP